MALQQSSIFLRPHGQLPRLLFQRCRHGTATSVWNAYRKLQHISPPGTYPKRRLFSTCLRSSGPTFRPTSQRMILPAGPQVIDGTANDPAPIPKPVPTHGSYHWTFERTISVSLIPLTLAPFAAGTLNPALDALFCALIIIHSHVGFQSIIIDYIPSKRFPVTRSLFWWGLRAGTIIVAVGLYEFETNDVGLTEAVTRIWNA